MSAVRVAFGGGRGRELTIEELRGHLLDVVLMAATLGIIALACVAVSIAVDAHAMRKNQIQAAADFRTGVFSRLDSLLWKCDTLLTLTGAMNKSLVAGLTQVRVQTKQSSDDQAHALQVSTQSTAAVTKELASTTKALEAVAESPPTPVVHVEAAKALEAAQPVVVNQPAPQPVVMQPEAEKTPEVEPRRSRWRWLGRLWPFGAHGRRAADR